MEFLKNDVLNKSFEELINRKIYILEIRIETELGHKIVSWIRKSNIEIDSSKDSYNGTGRSKIHTTFIHCLYFTLSYRSEDGISECFSLKPYHFPNQNKLSELSSLKKKTPTILEFLIKLQRQYPDSIEEIFADTHEGDLSSYLLYMHHK